MSQAISTVTFGVIAYNEQLYLPDLLNDLTKQTYDKGLIEVILVDGDSHDNTWGIMEAFQHEHKSDYMDIKLLRNHMRVQPAGWNIVIQNSTAEVLLRIDAHARLPVNFIENNVKCINSGEYVCGGPRENIIDENTAWKNMLLDAEQSMFGAGIASYRKKSTVRKYVKSLFHGCYRREVLNNVGLFNENLIRTEDNEFHYRIRKAGYNICYDPCIKSYYQTRNTLKGMIKQKYKNGLWIGKTIHSCPKCISIFHLVPFAFVCAGIVSTILLLLGIIWPALLLWCLYGIANILMTIMAVIQTKRRSLFCIFLPFVFLLLHVGYGIGTIIGIVQG